MDSSPHTSVQHNPHADNESVVEDLRAQVRQLEAQILARDNLLAVAAHELRNPMHTILLLVRAAMLIAEREQATSVTPKLERIRHVVDTYIKRATLLLDSVRLDAKGWAAERTRLDLSELVREICASHEPEAQFAGCTMRLSLPPTLRGTWDRLAVEQIITNLVSNAIKYSDGKPVEITLAAQGDQARLTVHDQGPGIAVDDQARIFERFQQAIGSGQRRSGFGIGLWLVRTLVEAHGGSVTLRSQLGEGATFTVLLPGLQQVTDSMQKPTDGTTSR
jgi:two-component system OmpR family sensor kinase